MKKKQIMCGALAAAVTLAATMSGCSLVSTNIFADMDQVIATVDISRAENFDKELADYKTAIGSSSVIKRDLVSYYITAGSSIMNSGSGYDTYEKVFNLLVDSLVNNAVLTQYSTMYLLKEKAEAEKTTAAKVVEKFNSYEKKSEKYEYLLGADTDDVKIAEYRTMSSFNSYIDSFEKEILKEDESESGSATRSTPKNVDTEREDYYPATADKAVDYNIYTGYKGNRLEDSGIYEENKLKGSTNSTRIRAYSDYIDWLADNNLIDPKEEKDVLRSVKQLKYYESQYVLQLEQRIIEKYTDLYEEERQEKLKENNYAYLQHMYEDITDRQTDSYKADGFNSTVDGMSDTSFILYAPATEDADAEAKVGFVYNILLPFSASQNAQLTALQQVYKDEDSATGYGNEYYKQRNDLLMKIKTVDQRAAWFNGQTEYAFNAAEAGWTKASANGDKNYYGSSGWLFFENNLTKDYRYEKISNYTGKYAFNGTVIEKEDGYVLKENELTIDDMLGEFSNYIAFVLGSTNNVTTNKVTDYGATTEFFKMNGSEYALDKKKKKQVDYSKLIYATGSVSFGTEAGSSAEDLRTNVFNPESVQNKVLSAVNELQYAYTTDTGVLSKYVGYSVDVGETSYIKEFEYAAQQAMKTGAGSFAVCAGDYGWHLIYVTYTFTPDAKQYGANPDWAGNIGKESTFENLFYEMVKSTDIKDVSTTRRTEITVKYNVEDKTVTKYVDRYQDLLDMDNNN